MRVVTVCGHNKLLCEIADKEFYRLVMIELHKILHGRTPMNLVRRTFKVVNWLLFGKGDSVKDLALRVVEELRDGAEIEIGKKGIFLRYKKEF